MPDEDDNHLREMLEAAHVCRYFVEGRTRTDLDDELMFYYAVVKAVELIGEVAWRVSGNTRAENPEIEWDEIVAMRHHLVHGFRSIDRDKLWTVAQHHVPVLITQLEATLE